MTSPIDPEEDNSNLVSSSGSSPVFFTDVDETDVLQVLPSKASSTEITSKRQRYFRKHHFEFLIHQLLNTFFRRVPLEPFVHQVGGHFPMVCLAKETLCKPMNEREHKFYKSMAKSLIPFVPRYEGTMRVQVHGDDHGYITLTGHPPPNFKTSRKYSIHHQMLQLYRQCDPSARSKSRSSSSIYSKDDESKKYNIIF